MRRLNETVVLSKAEQDRVVDLRQVKAWTLKQAAARRRNPLGDPSHFHHGLLEHGGPIGTELVFDIASASKQFTADAIVLHPSSRTSLTPFRMRPSISRGR